MAATTTTRIGTESKDLGGFYVPRFKVKVDGANLPNNVLLDVMTLTYHDDIEGLDGFELTVNNWDATKQKFKYIGSETAAQLTPGNPDYALMTLFEPCAKEVVIQMGYGDKFVNMMRGNFTTMEPRFSSTNPTLTVRGINVLNQLKKKQYTKEWKNKKASEVAKNIATLTDGGKKRFPMEIITDPASLGNEKSEEIISESNQYDLDFLLKLAAKHGYVLALLEEDTTTGKPRRLYFGPSEANPDASARAVTFELRWGESIVDFKPTLSTAKQVTKVTVKGFNRTSRTPVSRTVTIDDPRIKVNKDLIRLINTCEHREEIVVTEPVFTNCQARERAIAILLEQFKKIVTAEVTTVGLPDLRAGKKVKILNVGARLEGTYFVTKTTHTISDAGYTSKFSARREEPDK